MQAFNPGDPVSWPTAHGWQSGTVLRVDPVTARTPDGFRLETCQLTIRERGGRVITRHLRGCRASIPGPHVVPAWAQAEAA